MRDKRVEGGRGQRDDVITGMLSSRDMEILNAT